MSLKKLIDEIGGAVEDFVEEVFDEVTAVIEGGVKDERTTVLQELALLTKDKPADIERRSLGVYLSIVRHIKAGGSVKFIDAKGVRTLKVPLR